MRLLARLWVFALFVLPIGGCNEVTDPTTASLNLSVGSVDCQYDTPGKCYPLGESVPLEDAQLCESGTARCELTLPDGRVSIQLPLGRETSVTLTKKGYGPYLVPMVIRSSVEGQINLVTDEVMTDAFHAVMSPYPLRGTGTINVFLSVPFARATYRMVDATGEPFYHDEDGRPSSSLGETTSRGGGGFVEVTPGDAYQVTLGGEAQRCSPRWAWPGEDANSIRLPVRENYITYAIVDCPPP